MSTIHHNQENEDGQTQSLYNKVLLWALFYEIESLPYLIYDCINEIEFENLGLFGLVEQFRAPEFLLLLMYNYFD